MKCSCQAQCPDNAKFCYNCGREFIPDTKPAGKQVKPRGSPFEVSEDKLRLSSDSMRQSSAEALEALRAKKRSRAWVGFGIGVVVAAPLAGMAAFAKETGGVGLALIPLGAGLIWAYFAMRFDSSDYYSLPHSRDASGGHRCIWCGGRGIWRKGQYKSNATFANCSSCKTLLFNE